MMINDFDVYLYTPSLWNYPDEQNLWREMQLQEVS
jgi:hypothetical protein